jgi:serine/threonine protein kinase
VGTDKDATGGVGEENHIRQDEHLTKSMSTESAFPHSTRAFAGPLETMIEGYEILEGLPLGGQAVVYKAIQKATKRIVAVKVLLQGPHASARAQYRFEREVDLAASLHHPNIVTIYDSGIAHGQYYFAMEYVEGKPLDKYAQSEKLSLRQTMGLINKVCSAVAYAHQRGVIHRDLKPSNIMVDTGGEPHILDFGLAKLVDGSEQATEETVMTSIPGKVIGTLAFMSPEQASGQPSATDVRTDVYSIGMILYKVLTDNFPYDVSGSMLAILRNIQEAEPKRPSKLIRRFNSEVEAILLKALAKEPNHRYQSSVELQHDIDYWLKGLPISARADSSIYLLRKLLIRHRYASTVVGLLLLIVLGFSYVSFDLYITSRRAHRQSEAMREQLTTEIARSGALGQRVMFRYFIQAWNAGESEQAKVIGTSFSRGSREWKGVLFWVDPRPLTEKVNEFRQKQGKSESCFAEFVIAEHYLRDGNQEEAIKAYRRCLSYESHLKKDQWLASQVKSRLNELGGENRQGKTSPAVKD